MVANVINDNGFGLSVLVPLNNAPDGGFARIVFRQRGRGRQQVFQKLNGHNGCPVIHHRINAG